MITINHGLTPQNLAPDLARFWDLSAEKIRSIDTGYDRSQGSPVFTVRGRYTTRGWTEWTQGFEFGSAVLQFDATGDEGFLELGRRRTLAAMAPHVSHFGVHDHGFNNISTYGNLLRLMREGRIPEQEWERAFYELALKVSGAAQARRWTPLPGDAANHAGFIYSFNGPHSLFVDTIRSCRSLVVAHLLGHRAFDEGDREVLLRDRSLAHAAATARFSVFYGEGRDRYDTEPGRTAHESVFNTNDGQFRCPNAQQGFSGFTTWTRGLAWAMLGFAEQLEFLSAAPDFDGREDATTTFRRAARATCDFYIKHAAADGIPYWDTGAPDLHRLGDDFLNQPAEPDNPFEPADSSAAAIGCQGLIRLGRVLGPDTPDGNRYFQAGLTTLRTLVGERYLSANSQHQGLILHSVYHRPNGWDHIPQGSTVPNGESSMWGDYHAREAALYVGRLAEGQDYRFFDCADLP